jgi:hypothetical protein
MDNNQYLLQQDAIHGAKGRATMEVDGRIVEMFGVVNIKADIEYQTEDFRVVGTTTVQKKITGKLLTGTAQVYYGTPAFAQIAQEHQSTGRMPPITLSVTNNDNASSVGTQTTALYNVQLNKIPIAMLDAEQTTLKCDITFNYTHFAILQPFKNQPSQLGSS